MAVMIRRTTSIFLVFILGITLVAPPQVALACGPDFETPIYTPFYQPEDRDSNFERGQLGILQGGYWHIYLFEAYRNLSGRAFNEKELKTLKDWPGDDSNTDGATQPAGEREEPQDWIKSWQTLRDQALGKPEKELEANHDERGITRNVAFENVYYSYYNCLPDAFKNAVGIGNERKKQFGAGSPNYKSWITAQDQVFENCSGGNGFPPKAELAIPPGAANADDPEIIRQDRAYQIGAAYFYAGNLDAAQSAFEQIAKDSESPYQKIASYLIARVLIRRATLNAKENGFDPKTMAQAERELREVLADKNAAEFHGAAQRRLGFVRIRLHPRERLHELENAVLETSATQDWKQDLTDYLWLLDHQNLVRGDSRPDDDKTGGSGRDLTDWIESFQSTDNAFEHCLERWQETKSLAWLAASLMKADPKDTVNVRTLTAAARVDAESPAFLTLAFHRLRLLQQTRQNDLVRSELDQLLARQGKEMPLSARNQFFALRMKVASNLSEFLQFAIRVPSNAASEAEPQPGAPEFIPSRRYFDSDASTALTEKLPMKMLAAAARSNALPEALRRDVAIAAWTRAVLLNKEQTAEELSPLVSELEPEVKGALEEYISAPTGRGREFAAVFAILRNPGFRPFVSANPGRGWFFASEESHFNKIDSLRDNWWCSLRPASQDEGWGRNYYRMFSKLSGPLNEIYPDGVVSEPAFLSAEQRSAAQQEITELYAQPWAAAWLGKRATEWAEAHPDDARVPEALHLVVRAWRYGCDSKSEVNYSKVAFQLLHKQYPESEWTKKTPYWY
jgi:hypothetical protein